MGPWRAAQRFTHALKHKDLFETATRVRTDLFGSLAKTGRGHGTDVAVLLGLSGEDPVTCDTASIAARVERVVTGGTLMLEGRRSVAFHRDTDLVFNFQKTLPFHPNALTFTAYQNDRPVLEETYYSIGGGFVVQEHQQAADAHQVALPYPAEIAATLQEYCDKTGKSISQIMLANELVWRSADEVRAGVLNIWRVMEESMHVGCSSEGILPGGLNVVRRAATISRRLLGDAPGSPMQRTLAEWKRDVARQGKGFDNILKWVSCFALAVNEVNASFGRVVTAPTNGAAGVIPAVLMYYELFHTSSEQDVIDFLLTAAQVGIFFKKGATISAAMGGCQAEIGVSSAMAAAGLTQLLGGTPAQCLMAAEIAMEHHLGMTCDPIGGLVQIPCIERNTMGAVKAIAAANIAVESNPAHAKVSLDGVIKTMWETAQDMQSKYKETAEGGLAIHIPVTISEC